AARGRRRLHRAQAARCARCSPLLARRDGARPRGRAQAVRVLLRSLRVGRRALMDASAVHLPEGAAFDATAGGARTLPRSWARHFARAPERIALADERGAELRYGALDAATRRAAGRLHA